MRPCDLARFVGLFLVVLVGMAALWPTVNAAYHDAVVAVAEAVAPQTTGYASMLGGFAAYYGVGLFVALLLATPGLRWTRRTASLALGLILLFGVHVLSRALAIHGALHASDGSFSYLDAWSYVFSTAGQALWPVVIWAALVVRPRWLRSEFGRSRGAERDSRWEGEPGY